MMETEHGKNSDKIRKNIEASRQATEANCIRKSGLTVSPSRKNGHENAGKNRMNL